MAGKKDARRRAGGKQRKGGKRRGGGRASGGASRSGARGAEKVRYAVVGLGHIAQAAVLPAFEHARKNSELVGLFSDDPEKRRKLGRTYSVDAWDYSEYEAVLGDGGVDAVYIALPNHLHAGYSIRAARAGVHVLCEKPMAVTEQECADMIRAAEEARVRLMVAYRLHFEAANLKAVDLVASGRIGDPLVFSSTFTMQVEDEDNIRLVAADGGGTLYDLGVYCINAARYLFRAEPEEVACFTAAVPGDERFSEVEQSASCLLRFPEGRLATFTTSFGASSVSTLRLVGTEGDLELEPAYSYAKELRVRLTSGGRTREKSFPKRDQFGPELVYFSDCVLQDREPEPSGEEGLIDVRVVRALYESARRGGAPVALGVLPRPGRRPEPGQRIDRPAVEEPELVEAESPKG